MEFRGRSRWDKVACIGDQVLSLLQVDFEVPVEYSVRCKNLKHGGINVEAIRVDDQTMRVWMSSPNESMLRGHFRKQVKKRSRVKGAVKSGDRGGRELWQ